MSEKERLHVREQIAALEQSFRRLIVELEDTMRGLEHPGVPPTPQIIDMMMVAKENFESVLKPIYNAASRELSECPPLENVDSVVALNELFDEIEAERERKRVYRILEQIEKLAYQDGEEFEPLETIKAQARDMKARFDEAENEQSMDEYIQISEARHPFNKLLDLVHFGDQIDDEKWDALYQIILSVFGRRLATAAARDKLVPAKLGEIEITQIEISQEMEQGQPVPPIRRPTPPAAATPVIEEPATEDLISVEAEPEILEPVLVSDTNDGIILLDEAEDEVISSESPEFAESAHDGVEVISIGDDDDDGLDVIIDSAPDGDDEGILISVGEVSQDEPSDVDFLLDDEDEPEPPPPPRGTGGSGPPPVREVPPPPPAEEQTRGVERLEAVWSLIRDGRYSLAYQIGASALALEPEKETSLSVPLLRALALGFQVTSAEDPAVQELKLCVQEMYPYFSRNLGNDPLLWEEGLLMLAFSLKPTLLAPMTHAASVLDSVMETLPLWNRLPAVEDLAKSLLALSRMGIELSSNLLKGWTERDIWELELRSLNRDAQAWFEENRGRDFKSGSELWEELIASDGLVSAMIRFVVNDMREQIPVAGELVRRLGYAEDVAAELQGMVKKSRGLISRRKGPDDQAMSELVEKILEVVELTGRWVSMVEQEPDAMSDFSLRKLTDARNHVGQHVRLAMQQVEDHLEQGGVNERVTAGMVALLRSIKDLSGLFDPNRSEPAQSLGVRHILNSELLRVPGLLLDEDWEPENMDHPALLEALMLLAADGEPDWEMEFSRLMDAGDATGMDRIIELLRISSASPAMIQDLKELRDSAV